MGGGFRPLWPSQCPGVTCDSGCPNRGSLRSTFRYRLFTPTGDHLAAITLDVSTVEQGETISARDGRRYRVLEVVYVDELDSPYRAVVTAEPVDGPPS